MGELVAEGPVDAIGEGEHALLVADRVGQPVGDEHHDEAGGVVTDWAGDEEAWLASGDILAAPPPVHKVLLDLARSTC